MARTGKIARLPLPIREQLNDRLRDNENGQVLLAWLNAEPKVQAVLKEHFSGEPINDQNLSNWRSGGFAEWMEQQEHVHKVQRLSELSLRLAQASGGNLSEGLLAIAAGKLQEAMEAGVDMVPSGDGEDAQMVGVPIDKLAKALASIRKMELDAQKLELDRKGHSLKADALALEKQKFQRQTAELFLKYFEDRRTREIAEGKGSQDNKVAELIQLWFGEMPEGIGPDLSKGRSK